MGYYCWHRKHLGLVWPESRTSDGLSSSGTSFIDFDLYFPIDGSIGCLLTKSLERMVRYLSMSMRSIIFEEAAKLILWFDIFINYGIIVSSIIIRHSPYLSLYTAPPYSQQKDTDAEDRYDGHYRHLSPEWHSLCFAAAWLGPSVFKRQTRPIPRGVNDSQTTKDPIYEN